MISPTIYRWFIFFCCSSLLIAACKNEPEENSILLNIEAPKLVFSEGDSIIFRLKANNNQVAADTWTTTIGNIDNSGNWIAPLHISADTILAMIVATYQNKQTSIQIQITKKAFQENTVSYALTIQPLLANNCNFSGCHANGSRAGKVELSVYDNVKNNVIPFNADGSKLYFSLIKTNPLRVMPPAGKLHANKIQSVWLWIEQGARNN
jgi:hypothetical protein